MKNQILPTLSLGLGFAMALTACDGGSNQQCRSAEELCENPDKVSPEQYPGCGPSMQGGAMMCADLSRCALHCGACGNECPEGVDCVDGRCRVSSEAANIYKSCGDMPNHRLCLAWAEDGGPSVEIDETLWSSVLRSGADDATIRTATTATIASTFKTFGGQLKGECIDVTRSMRHCGGCGKVCDGRACVKGRCLPNNPLLKGCTGMCDKASCCPDLPGFDCENEAENHDFTCVERVADGPGQPFVCIDSNTAVGVFGCKE